jgi:hypothetical protein
MTAKIADNSALFNVEDVKHTRSRKDNEWFQVVSLTYRPCDTFDTGWVLSDDDEWMPQRGEMTYMR